MRAVYVTFVAVAIILAIYFVTDADSPSISGPLRESPFESGGSEPVFIDRQAERIVERDRATAPDVPEESQAEAPVAQRSSTAQQTYEIRYLRPLRVLVLDENHDAVPDARIRIVEVGLVGPERRPHSSGIIEEGRSDSTGHYSSRTRGANFVFEVEKPGVGIAGRVKERYSDEVQTVILKRPTTLRVTVQDQTGRPRSGATIELHAKVLAFHVPDGTDNTARITTKVDGRVELQLIPGLETPVMARWQDEASFPQQVQGTRAGEQREITLELKGRFSISGSVELVPGQREFETRVEIERHLGEASPGPDLAWSSGVEIDDQGRFTIIVPAAGLYRVVAGGPGGRKSRPALVQLDDDEPRATLRLAFLAQTRIRLRVLDHDGAPMAKVSVTAKPTAASMDARSAPLERPGVAVADGRSDAAGLVELGPLLLGCSYDLELMLPGLTPSFHLRTGFVASDQLVEIRLTEEERRSFAVLGKIVEEASGEPMSGVELNLYIHDRSEDAMLLTTTVTSPEGRYALTGLQPGHRYLLRANFGWHRNDFVPIELFISDMNADRQLDLLARRRFAIELLLVDEKGQALPHRHLDLVGVGADGRLERRLQLQANATGRLRLRFLAPGTYAFHLPDADEAFLQRELTPALGPQVEIVMPTAPR